MKRFNVLLVSLLALSSIAPAYAVNDDWHYTPRSCDERESRQETDTPKQGAVSSAHSWLNEGTEEYKTAKKIFDILTNDYGTSGAFASGVLANVAEESGFIEDRAQGPGVLRFGIEGKTAPAGSVGGGGGLFQFTPFSKFTESSYWGKNGKGWSTKNQVDYVFDTSIRTRSMEIYSEFRGTQLYNLKTPFESTEQALSTDNPRKASIIFQMGYEGPEVYHPSREDLAVLADKAFNKDHIKANESKWKIGQSSDVTNASVEKNPSDSVQVDDCETQQKVKLSLDDFSGSHNQNLSGGSIAWKKDDLPEELKEFLIDPEIFGLSAGDCSKWPRYTGTTDFFLNGQCVALSKVMLGHIWEIETPFLCNGISCADAAAKAYGGEPSSKPSKGAVSQVDTGTEWGHTYIVSHVFENGDILAIEQNISNFSGAANGEACNWNYTLISKDLYESQNSKFFSPASVGKSLSSKLQ